MNQKDCDRTLALAGVVQAAYLVNEIANNGTLSNDYYQATLASVFKLEAASVEDVYGSRQHVVLGLKTLRELLTFEQNNTLMPVVRYSLSLLHLERKLANNPKMLAAIREKLMQIQSQVDYFSLTDERVLASLATLYQDTISTFNLRIKVTGNPLHLKNAEVANRIRALLLCGIRSAFLWQQLGGRRWSLLFSFSTTHDAIEYLLNH
jgi:high frequency lysogenization protein